MKLSKNKMQLSSLILAGLVLSNCASTPRGGGSVSNAEVKDATPEYILRGRYPVQPPAWALDFETFKRSNDGHGTTYFLGESGDSNERIAGCEFAALDATRKVAQQIAQFISSQVGSAKTGLLLIDKDSRTSESLGSHFQDVVAAESLAFLTGVQEFAHYWEERDYSLSGGKKRVYICQSVVTIDDAHLRDAAQRVGKDVGSKLSDPEAKSLVVNAFEKLEHGFGRAASTETLDSKAGQLKAQTGKVESE